MGNRFLTLEVRFQEEVCIFRYFFKNIHIMYRDNIDQGSVPLLLYVGEFF